MAHVFSTLVNQRLVFHIRFANRGIWYLSKATGKSTLSFDRANGGNIKYNFSGKGQRENM
jgi:hypothetical protein